ncbi:hypothetical protein ACFQHV_18065 [Promicromonospora thailandica]|uniref:hypothetical protein n=1 Tax=Promicromonospora thailandica TaxID=765201 RepID=UPI0020A5FCC6|nr:hypothetical protein [Promicromonospora thailandica]
MVNATGTASAGRVSWSPMRRRWVDQAVDEIGRPGPARVVLVPALLPLLELHDRLLHDLLLQQVGRRAALRMLGPRVHRGRGDPPGPDAIVAGRGSLDEPVLGELAEVAAGQRLADPELACGLGAGDRALAADELEVVASAVRGAAGVSLPTLDC